MGLWCLVWVDTFTGWVEAFPCRTEQAKEVVMALVPDIIPCFHLPQGIHSDNGTALRAAVTQGVSQALSISLNITYTVLGDPNLQEK